MRLIRKFDFPKKLGILEALYGKKLSEKGHQWVKCWNGIIWKLDLADPCHRWIVYGKYEGGMGIDFAKRQLRQGGNFIDSGSNIGQWLLYLGGLNGVKTVAFEPVRSQRKWLEQCLAIQSGWRTHVEKCGLGAKSATVEIQCDGARSTLNLDWFKGKNFAREVIEIRRLDDVLKEHNIDEIAFWKLDVEGAELQALQGAETLLKNQRIQNIFFECHPDNYAAVLQLLESHRYQISCLKKGKLVTMPDAPISQTEDLIATVKP